VAARLHGDLPRLDTFCTLSPLPGFCRWLEAAANASDKAGATVGSGGGGTGGGGLLTAAEAVTVRCLLAHAQGSAAQGSAAQGGDMGAGASLLALLATSNTTTSNATTTTTNDNDAPAGSSPAGSCFPVVPWHRDGDVCALLEPVVLRLAARYVAAEKKKKQQAQASSSAAPAAAAVDPVANFHLRNGAALHGLNWRGDLSAKGLAASAGIMANYL